MKAIMAYNYAKGKWEVWMMDAIDVDLHTYISLKLNDEGKYLFPCVISTPVESFEYRNGRYSATFPEDGEDFPEVTTLEQSIERNRKTLTNTLNYLRR